MKKLIFFFCGIFVALILFSCKGQPGPGENEPAKKDHVTRLADSLLKIYPVPGMQIGVFDNGKRKYYSFGYADTVKKMPFDSATIFEIGSITKTFTAYVLEHVLNEKSISDSSPVIAYLPAAVQQNRNLEKITLYSLLNHTSGLPRLPGNINLLGAKPYDDYSDTALYAYLKKCVPESPGKVTYSNLAAGLAGVVAENISGKPYSSLVKEYIFDPFRMTYYPDDTLDNIQNKSRGYSQGLNSSYWKANALAGAYAIKSTSDDMLTYLEKMLNPPGERSKRIVDKLLVPTASVSGDVDICRAWHTMKFNGKLFYWHDGMTYGFTTFCAFSPESKTGVIIAINEFNKSEVSVLLGVHIMNHLNK